jgi:methionyl-tRNA formyltransferase
MRVEKELDAGPMFAKVVQPIAGDGTSVDVERRLAELGATLLVQVVDQMAAGTAREEAQDAAASTYAPKITRDEGLIDWSLPAEAIHNRVRGLYPWPHAYSFLDGKRLIVLKTTVAGTGGSDIEPGAIVEVTRDAFRVAAGHGGSVSITRVQPEGRKPMAVRDFLAGHKLEPGSRFTQR